MGWTPNLAGRATATRTYSLYKAWCRLSHMHGISCHQESLSDTERCLEPQPQLTLETQRVETAQWWVARWICCKFRQELNYTGPTKMISHIGRFSLEVCRRQYVWPCYTGWATTWVMMSTISLLNPARRSTRVAAAADGSQDLTRRLTWGALSAKLNETTTLMPHISRTKRTDNMNFSTRIQKNILSQHAKSWYSRENIVLLGVVLTCHLGTCIPAKKRMPN